MSDEEGRFRIRGLQVLVCLSVSVCLSVCLSLNGEPEPGIAVEALSQEECGKVVEEGMSDEEGRFRIRGLQVGLSVACLSEW